MTNKQAFNVRFAMSSITLDFKPKFLMTLGDLPASGMPLLTPKPGPTFIYVISRGLMLYGATGKPFALGLWSGHGDARNDPTKTNLKGVGPLPVGLYEYGFARDGGHLGPLVMPLHQIEGVSFGRSAFYVHGASVTDPANSSDGCIIMPRQSRFDMDSWPTKVRLLMVRA